MRVLLVDDSDLVRTRFAETFAGREEMQVVGEAESVATAVTAIHELKPDVVILDLRLPDGDGIEVLEALKDVRPRPRVVVVTSYAYEQLRERCLKAGADAFLDKKRIGLDTLPRILNKWIDRPPPTGA